MGFSVVELEAIGKTIGTTIREQQEALFGKVAEGATLNKMIEDAVRETLKKSSGHGVPWTQPIPPQDVITIEKALYEPAGEDEALIKFQTWNDDVYTICKVLDAHPSQLNMYAEFQRTWSELAKALNTATAGSGAEWIPTGYSSRMIQFVELESMVASKFFSFQMPSPTYIYPVMLNDGTAYLGGEATTDSPSMYRASTAGTSDLTFTAKKIVANYPVSDEMTEDSIVPVLPTLQASIARAMSKALDGAIINGDTTTTHFDTGYTVASDDARRAWKGIRRLVSDANAVTAMKKDGSTWTTALGLGLLRNLVEDMGVRGIRPGDLMFVVNTNMFNKLKGLDEVTTVDKFGTAATVKNGVLSAIDGIEIVLSPHVEEKQNSSGIYDGTTETDTQLLIVHKPSFWRGIRKGMSMERVRKPLYGNEYLVSTMRTIWKPIYDSTTLPVAGWLYNITK